MLILLYTWELNVSLEVDKIMFWWKIKKKKYFKIISTNQLCKIKWGAFISQAHLDFLLSLNMNSGNSLTVICLSQQWLYLRAHLLNEHNTQHPQSHSLCVVIKGLCYFYAHGRCFLHIQFKITNWHAERSHMSRFYKNKHTHTMTHTNMWPFSSAYGCQRWLGKSEVMPP